MIPSGIVDPTKVTRSALENAASICSCVLTTESLVTDKPDPAGDAAKAAAAANAAGMGGMYLIPKRQKITTPHPGRVPHPVHAPGFCLF